MKASILDTSNNHNHGHQGNVYNLAALARQSLIILETAIYPPSNGGSGAVAYINDALNFYSSCGIQTATFCTRDFTKNLQYSGKPFRIFDVPLTQVPIFDGHPQVPNGVPFRDLKQADIERYVNVCSTQLLNACKVLQATSPSNKTIIINVHHGGVLGLSAIKTREELGDKVKVFISGHNMEVIFHDQLPPLMKRTFRDAAHGADRFVVLTEDHARKIKELYDLPTDKLIMIPHGVDTDRFSLDLPAIAKSDNLRQVLESGRTLVSYIGRLVPGKGLEKLIETFADKNLLREFPSVDLVICGSGKDSYVNEIKSLILRCDPDIQKRIIMTGYIPNNQIPHLIQGSAFVTSLSEDEGLARITLETHACGTPFWGTNIPGFSSCFINPENTHLGSLVPLDANTATTRDSMRQMLNRVAQKDFNPLRIRGHVEHNFSMERMFENNFRLYL